MKLKTHEYKILVIDDEAANMDILQETLSDVYQLDFAKTAEDGWKLIQEKEYQILLLDVMLPGMDGYTLCKKIRNDGRFDFLKIFLVSGLSLLDERLKGYEVGADDYITKPFNSDELLAKLNVFCRLYDAEKKLNELNENLELRVNEKTKTLEELYITDELTQLHNRQKLLIDLNEREIGVLFLANIVSFGSINLALGLDAGNEILIEFSKRIQSLMKEREDYDVYRLNGDEFACVVFGKCENQVDEQIWIRKFHRELDKINVEYDDADINITTSLGCVINGETRLLRKATLAMMKSKSKSFPKIEFYKSDFEDEGKYKENVQWMRKVRDALEQKKIVPFFQAIKNNQTNKIEKFECLARLIQSDKVVSPFFFLQPAKQAGLLPSITLEMLYGSFSVMKDFDYGFSINITDEDLLNSPMVRIVEKALTENNIHPERVVFEVLENISISSHRKVLEELNQIKRLGCQIAIDDFGTENSNFAQIMDLQVDYIKIDGQFIKKIHEDDKSYKITSTITDFAHNIGAKVIAEFVHCQEVQDKVVELEIDYSQGYHISEPLSSISVESVGHGNRR